MNCQREELDALEKLRTEVDSRLQNLEAWRIEITGAVSESRKFEANAVECMKQQGRPRSSKLLGGVEKALIRLRGLAAFARRRACFILLGI